MNSIATEPGTTSVANFVNQFFADLPQDGTKYKLDWQKFMSITTVNEDTKLATFVLPKLTYPYSYQIHQLLVSVKLDIVEATSGNLPANDKHVTGINNMLGSLFSKVRMWINDQVLILALFHRHL